MTRERCVLEQEKRRVKGSMAVTWLPLAHVATFRVLEQEKRRVKGGMAVTWLPLARVATFRVHYYGLLFPHARRRCYAGKSL